MCNVAGRRAADEVIKTSFDQAVDAIASTTGAVVPKRQLEELAGCAAEDFDAFYEGRCCQRQPHRPHARERRRQPVLGDHPPYTAIDWVLPPGT